MLGIKFECVSTGYRVILVVPLYFDLDKAPDSRVQRHVKNMATRACPRVKGCQNQDKCRSSVSHIFNFLAHQALGLFQRDLDSWELEQLLSGKYDKCGCRLTVMTGAGGTEAQDWALMLQRMYLRFFERRGFKYKIVEEEVGFHDRGEAQVKAPVRFHSSNVPRSPASCHETS